MSETAVVAALTIRHQLPHRLRLACSRELSGAELELVTAQLVLLHPDLVVRPTAHRRGVVITRPDDTLLCPALAVCQLAAVIRADEIHGPALPPSAFSLWLDDTRQGSIKVLMALAIAGWALPILPGTPFFLMAWWLGWRPETAPESAEPKLEPAVLEPGR
ncbi:MAG: hypothetical protein ACKOCM_07240 [Cyanobacteriota bacterium]